MTDLQFLFIVLAWVYLWECLVWLPRGTVAFVRWTGRHWRLVHPLNLLSNRNGGFILAPPLPPLGTLFVSVAPPISGNAEYVLAYVSAAINPAGRAKYTGATYAFRDARKITSKGKSVHIGGQVFMRTPSTTYADFLAGFIRRLEAGDPSQRETMWNEFWSDCLNTDTLLKRWQDFQKHLRSLRIMANVQFAYLFLVCPWITWSFSIKHAWPFLLFGLLSGDIVTAWFFHRAHKQIFPRDEDDRFSQTMTLVLSPCAVVRAHDLLTRKLLETIHPLTLAKALGDAESFRPIAARYLRELRYPALPVCPDTDEIVGEIEAQSRQRTLKHVEAFLLKNNLNPEQLLQAPSPIDEASTRYCPRCLAQYTSSATLCPDCGGIPLHNL